MRNVLRAIRRQRVVDRAYLNGYEQGRYDERAERDGTDARRDPVSDEELIAALAEEYARWTAAPYEPDDWQRNNGDDLARAHLLPVVRRWADQRAAEELRGVVAGVMQQHGTSSPAAKRIRDRADTLRGEAL